jgi:hypothetical protein
MSALWRDARRISLLPALMSILEELEEMYSQFLGALINRIECEGHTIEDDERVGFPKDLSATACSLTSANRFPIRS